MLKIGVLGAGHLGSIHLKLLKQIDAYEVVGFCDPDDERAAFVEKEYGVPRFLQTDQLLDNVDAIDIVTPTVSHFDLAYRAIKKSKHVFIEKPLSSNMEEAEALIALAEEAGIKAMVGHVERFNPAFLSVQDRELKPMFIEAHRLAKYNPRGTDVSVVLDLMIHDIDIVLSMIKANVRRISASGVAVISNTPDMANARIEFDNGCVANLTASRISIKNMRKMRVFQKDTYLSIDFAEKTSRVFTLADGEEKVKNGSHPANHTNGYSYIGVNTGDDLKKKVIHIEKPVIKPVNSIKMELEEFHDAIVKDKEPPITFEDGYNAMRIANMILNKIGRDVLI